MSLKSVSAVTYDVSGNAANSQNGITVQNSNTNTQQQNNTFNVQNNINANANTGGNSVSGNSGDSLIVTGDASVNIKVGNLGNTNISNTNNCCPSPTPTITKPPLPGTGGNTGGSGSSTGGGGSGSSSGGSGSVSSASSGSSDPQVMGLSNTAGENKTQIAFYLAGILCLGLAGKLLIKR